MQSPFKVGDLIRHSALLSKLNRGYGIVIALHPSHALADSEGLISALERAAICQIAEVRERQVRRSVIDRGIGCSLDPEFAGDIDSEGKERKRVDSVPREAQPHVVDHIHLDVTRPSETGALRAIVGRVAVPE